MKVNEKCLEYESVTVLWKHLAQCLVLSNKCSCDKWAELAVTCYHKVLWPHILEIPEWIYISLSWDISLLFFLSSFWTPSLHHGCSCWFSHCLFHEWKAGHFWGEFMSLSTCLLPRQVKIFLRSHTSIIEKAEKENTLIRIANWTSRDYRNHNGFLSFGFLFLFLFFPC